MNRVCTRFQSNLEIEWLSLQCQQVLTSNQLSSSLALVNACYLWREWSFAIQFHPRPLITILSVILSDKLQLFFLIKVIYCKHLHQQQKNVCIKWWILTCTVLYVCKVVQLDKLKSLTSWKINYLLFWDL